MVRLYLLDENADYAPIMSANSKDEPKGQDDCELHIVAAIEALAREKARKWLEYLKEDAPKKKGKLPDWGVCGVADNGCERFTIWMDPEEHFGNEEE